MTPYLQDADFTLFCGDALETLRGLPSESVHMCVTSPPFYGLRNYQVEGQIGLEPTPDEWVARLVEVFREVRRVLRKDGTLWLEIGDSYGSGPGSNRDLVEFASNRNQTMNQWGSRGGRKQEQRPHPYKPKDLVGAPWLLAFALRADGWYLRSEIIWAKPNPMPESVSDRPTTAHSRVFLLAKSPRYFFDAEAIREPHQEPWRSNGKVEQNNWSVGGTEDSRGSKPMVREYNPAGRNARSVWTIATQPLPDEHYAAFPEKLVERCILAGTSERGVCPECGAPWERMVERRSVERHELEPDDPRYRPSRYGGKYVELYGEDRNGQRYSEAETTGWQPTCGCSLTEGNNPAVSLATAANYEGGQGSPHRLPSVNESVPATVLDPFVGSGTTALVARRLGRRCLGIELSEKYCEMAARRTRQLSLLAAEGEGA